MTDIYIFFGEVGNIYAFRTFPYTYAIRFYFLQNIWILAQRKIPLFFVRKNPVGLHLNGANGEVGMSESYQCLCDRGIWCVLERISQKPQPAPATSTGDLDVLLEI